MSFLSAISTVVCMYFNGSEINAEGQPKFEYANASVSVPVDQL